MTDALKETRTQLLLAALLLTGFGAALTWCTLYDVTVVVNQRFDGSSHKTSYRFFIDMSMQERRALEDFPPGGKL